jgi:hypothetical protein
MSEPVNGTEVLVEAEMTLEEVAKKVEVVANTLGVMLLLMTRYPLPRELLVHMTKCCGVQFDETQAFRQEQQIVIPKGILPGH